MTRVRRSWRAAAALLTLAVLATAIPAPTTAEPTASRPATSLPAWLVGTWRMERGERTITETWFDGGSLLLGVSFTRTGDRTVEFEFLRIERRDGTLAYVAQPGGRPPTVFPLTAADDRSLRFENPAHDFPRVIRYMLESDTGLVAEISGPMNGKTESMRFEYRRAAAE
jgi:hypothetical protein